ncbi:MFS transporter [Marinihelvus fidelis]|uniref:MFS transporter n=1 Tax=Marinihelvus fidelis TaxID=2613842 RepID=A0A5N0T609_9GAMM|nr:MFS transporter [Marinihelvus fidelis]KAA9130485.1 MFS transporter [Marinihelvus fidelis]
MSGRSQFRLFTERRFGPFFVTQALGALNDNIFKNALAALLVFEASQMGGLNTDQLVNLSALLFILPFFLFSALFGQFADKFEKSAQIRRIKLFEVGLMGLAALGLWLGNLPLLLLVLFGLGFQSTIFGPIKYGILPQVLAPRELVGGNALVEMGTFVAILGGTIAGPLLAGVDTAWPMWVAVAALAVAVCGWLASLYVPRAAAVDPGLKINWNIFSESIRNLKFIGADRTVLHGVLGISWFWFFGATILVQVPSYTINVLGGDERLMSMLLGVFIVGISVGSLACEKLSNHRVEIGLVPLGTIGLTLFGIDLYFASPLSPAVGLEPATFFAQAGSWRIVFDLLMIGGFGGFYIVPLYALVQARSAASHRSRVIAGNNILNALFMVVAAVFAIIMLGAAGFTIPQLFLATAILNAVVALYIFTIVPEFLLRFVAWLLIHTIYRVKVTGLENIPEKGAVILACNHVSYVDPVIIMGMSPRPTRFVMWYKLYDIPVMRWLFRAGKAIPIASASEDADILAAAYEKIDAELAAGAPVGIFPEGGITRDGEIQPFKGGVAKIVEQNPVPVVPMALCHLWGSLFSRRDSFWKRRPYKLFGRIELRVGEPIPAAELTTERLEAAIRALRGDDR